MSSKNVVDESVMDGNVMDETGVVSLLPNQYQSRGIGATV
jgi:hypothetical protein